MHKRTVLTSSAYSVLQASGGLILHPYQTMQYLVEEKVFVWLTFIPMLVGLIFLIIWWICLQTFFAMMPFIGLWAFTAIWAMFFFVFWQILLLYLLVRFSISLKR